MSIMELDWYTTSSYLHCPRLGWLLLKGYRHEGRCPSDALAAGLALHRILESLLKSGELTAERANACAEVERVAIEGLSAKYPFDAFTRLARGLAEMLANRFPDAKFSSEQTLHAPLSPETNWWARVDVQAVLPDGSVYFGELKSSLYSLSLADIDAYMYSHGQISGQLWLGHRLYGDKFRGVAVLAAGFTSRQIEPINTTYSADRDLAHSYLVYDVADGLKNSLDQDDAEFRGLNCNPMNCVMFKNLCPMHAVCWRKQPLDEVDRDSWIAGKGWLSEMVSPSNTQPERRP